MNKSTRPVTTAAATANWFLDRAERAGLGVTPMKLLKLVYLAQGWHLAHHEEALFADRIEAWKYGPVVPSLYERFVQFGRHPISQSVSPPKLEDETTGLLESVWKLYGFLDAYELSDLTHKPDTPWSEAYSPGANKLIQLGSIQDHFRSLLQRTSASS